MLIASAAQKMIACSGGALHDIDHFLKVWSLARTIGELAALVHDIACPLCREKYGDTNGKHQELESPPLVEAFFADLPVARSDVERISWLVAHHHTYTNVDGPDHQILLETDFLVNAGESHCSQQMIQNFRQRVFRTQAGLRLLDSIFPVSENA